MARRYAPGVSPPPPEEDIRRTLARYCMFCDDGRFDEFGMLFTEGARFHVMGRTYEGREQIRTFMEKNQGPDARGKHLAVNSLIESDGWSGTARAWTDFAFIAQNQRVTSMGRYHDELVREGDKVWRIGLREIVFRGDDPQLTQLPPG